ncbi:MAG: exo-beta-N-acetylmuramidase NamZ family protein [Thermomicrobiales bacterium]
MKTGLERLLTHGLPQAAGQRAGLITNHTGFDHNLRRNVDLLRDRNDFKLTALFSPEHGLWGEIQAGVHVDGQTDARSGLPVHSLYGETHQPTPAMLYDLDLLIFDIQDLGVRFATRLAIMVGGQEAAARAGIAFVVLDRPNPISGLLVEGPILDPAFISLVGCHPIPLRHGMTLGELARLVAAERGWPEPLVIPIEGWQRDHWFDQTGWPWVPPSPNLPTLDSLTVYPGACLIEGANLSEGRGTTRPFEYAGAPWIDPFALAAELTQRHILGFAFRPAYFTPAFSKHAGAVCGGVQVHITDRAAARPVAMGIHLLHVLHQLSNGALAWRVRADGRHAIDLLYGSDRLRLALDGGADITDLMAEADDQARGFEDRRHPHLLYA